MPQFTIKNGPSKFDLMIAIFHTPETGEQFHPLTFTIEDNRKLKVRLMGAAIYEVDHEAWLIDGYLIDGKTVRTEYTGYFNTRDRKGFLKYD